MKPISKTAFYCAGVRMLDAERPRPVLGDTYARAFMTEEGLRLFEPFRNETRPNGSNVARHRIIDDLLRARLSRDPHHRVIIIGAGFDSRAFRLTGGRWVEFDEPQMIAFKEERLPAAGAPNPLQRITIDFETETLAERLAPFRGERVTVVAEGVSMYLSEVQLTTFAQTLLDTFPFHTLIMDLMTRTFRRRFGHRVGKKLREGMGAEPAPANDHPERLFLRAGYRLVERLSIPGTAGDLGAINLPRILRWTLLRSLVNGYQVHVFESTGRAESAGVLTRTENS